MSKPLRKLSWILGTLSVSTSIGQSAYIKHGVSGRFTESEQLSLVTAGQVQMYNGIGLCLLATRKTRMVIFPITALVMSTLMFSGIVFYSKF